MVSGQWSVQSVMAEICGGSEPLLNFTSLWLTNNPQVSSCFSRSVLVLVPALVLLANLVNTAVKVVSSERHSGALSLVEIVEILCSHWLNFNMVPRSMS